MLPRSGNPRAPTPDFSFIVNAGLDYHEWRISEAQSAKLRRQDDVCAFGQASAARMSATRYVPNPDVDVAGQSVIDKGRIERESASAGIPL